VSEETDAEVAVLVRLTKTGGRSKMGQEVKDRFRLDVPGVSKVGLK